MSEFLGFYFNNGFDHLACALAANAVADNCHKEKPLPVGATVVALAKKGEQYMVVRGVATGKVLETKPQDIWDEWEVTDTLVHEVKFKTKPVFVPVEVASRPTNSISYWHARELADFAFSNG